MRVSVLETCGAICVDPADGDKLFDKLNPLLAGGDAVELDFSGVTSLVSAFLNRAIGRLYASYDAAKLEATVVCVGLDTADQAVIQLVRANARRFYEASAEHREHLAETSKRAL